VEILLASGFTMCRKKGQHRLVTIMAKQKRTVISGSVALLLLLGIALPLALGQRLSYRADAESILEARIVQVARSELGAPYVFGDPGGNSPAGFNCTGFVWWVYQQVGINIPWSWPAGYLSVGVPVSESQLTPGDIIIFQNTWIAGPSHVEIYVGNGQAIGADSPSQGVHLDNLSDPYWSQHYYAARHVPAVDGPSISTSSPSTTTASMASGSSSPSSYVSVVAWRLHVRTGPGLGYYIQGLADYGQTLPVYGRSNDWIKTTWYGHPAWVAGWWTTPAH
jgi:hypothetical protein